MPLRVLVVEGNKREVRERHKAAFGMTPGESYAAALQVIEPGLSCDFAFPADDGANLPDSGGLEGYDAVVTTGSALNAYNVEPAVTRQVDLHRAVFRSRVPSFGSCWGIQIAAIAAGGDVRANPAGREIGFARRIARTQEGQGHPLLEGRPVAWDAPCTHLDVVGTLPGDITVLATNDLTPVQAAEIRQDGGVFWGVQYHPEFSLAELAVILRRYGPQMIREGFFDGEPAHAAYVNDLEALAADRARGDIAWRMGLDAEVLDDARRVTEIRNFIRHVVKPTASARGRA